MKIEVDLDAVAGEVGWLYIVWALAQSDEYANEIISELLDRKDITHIHKSIREIIEREVYKIK